MFTGLSGCICKIARKFKVYGPFFVPSGGKLPLSPRDYTAHVIVIIMLLPDRGIASSQPWKPPPPAERYPHRPENRDHPIGGHQRCPPRHWAYSGRERSWYVLIGLRHRLAEHRWERTGGLVWANGL